MKSIFTTRGKLYLAGAVLAGAILGAVLLRWGCSDSRYGGTLRLASAMKPTLINPLLTEESISRALVNLVFNGLVRLNTKGEMENDLVEDWELSEDKREYTFYLRQGVRFHDGAELTAGDVLFTYQELLKVQLEDYSGYIVSMIEAIDAPDKYTFTIKVREPFSPFMYYLDTKILPSHLFKGTKLEDNPHNYKPVGTGPFRFESWDEADTIVLKANEDYFERRAYLDEIRITRYPDREHVWTAFMRGELDVVFFLDCEDYPVVAKDSAFRASRVSGNRYYALIFNLGDPILKDLNVRKAIAHAVNRDELIQRTQDGHGIKCEGVFHPDSWAHTREVGHREYDPEEARRLLAASNWRDSDRDGLLEKNGKEAVIDLAYSELTPSSEWVAKVLRQQLLRVGIGARLRTQDPYVYAKDSGKAGSQSYLVDIVNCIEPDCESRIWPLKSHRRFEESVMPWRYIENLFLEARSEFAAEKRIAIYREIEAVVSDYQPVVFLFYGVDYSGWVSSLVGMDEVVSFYFPTDQIKNVFHR